MRSVVKRSVIGLSPLDIARSDETSGLPIFAPATHGMLRIDCQIADDTIVTATPLLGSMHRGAEKLLSRAIIAKLLGWPIDTNGSAPFLAKSVLRN